jgi:hypothetical protein
MALRPSAATRTISELSPTAAPLMVSFSGFFPPRQMSNVYEDGIEFLLTL